MAVVLGKDIRIYAGTSGTTPIIAGAKSCTISERCDLIEKASASNQTSKEFVGGRTEWEINISHLVVVGSEYQGLLKVNTNVSLSVVVNNVRKTGTAICQQADIGGAVGTLATGSVKLKGTGPLT
jgi:predicted secreted protein